MHTDRSPPKRIHMQILEWRVMRNPQSSWKSRQGHSYITRVLLPREKLGQSREAVGTTLRRRWSLKDGWVVDSGRSYDPDFGSLRDSEKVQFPQGVWFWKRLVRKVPLPSGLAQTEVRVFLGVNIEEAALLYLMGSLKFYSYIQDRKIVFQRTFSALPPALSSCFCLCCFHVFSLFMKGPNCRTHLGSNLRCCCLLPVWF